MSNLLLVLLTHIYQYLWIFQWLVEVYNSGKIILQVVECSPVTLWFYVLANSNHMKINMRILLSQNFIVTLGGREGFGERS